MLDSLGGLILVRLASCVLMLAANWLLYATTRRLFGYWPAVTAAALWAALGITQGLAAYATFDAPSLLLMATAAYCAIRADDDNKWLLALPCTILAANSLKYASVIFDPVVICLAALTLKSVDWRRVVYRLITLTAVISVIAVIFELLAGTAYIHGIMFTTIARKTGTGVLNLNPARTSAIVMFTWERSRADTGNRLRSDSPSRGYPPRAPLSSIASLVLDRWGTGNLGSHPPPGFTSVNKHDDFGIWFTAMAGGYALARGAELVTNRYVRAALFVPALTAVPFAFHLYSNGKPIDISANMTGVNQIIPYLQAESQNNYLLGGRLDDVALYDYHLAVPWWRITNDNYVKYPIPGRGGNASASVPGQICITVQPMCTYLQGPAAARAAIQAHWFAVVSFVGENHLAIDQVELDAVRSTPGYYLVSTLGGDTYIYAPEITQSG